MIQYPTFVYKKSKAHPDHGRPYIFKQVWNDFDREALLCAGWFATLKEALSGKREQVQKETPKVESPVPDDNAAPTRAELETKAKELGISFDGRTTDAKLLKRINHQIEGNK